MVPFSVLDLSPVVKGSTPAQAFRNTLDLARLAERLAKLRAIVRRQLREHRSGAGVDRE